jgi:hypothetical protein
MLSLPVTEKRVGQVVSTIRNASGGETLHASAYNAVVLAWPNNKSGTGGLTTSCNSIGGECKKITIGEDGSRSGVLTTIGSYQSLISRAGDEH